MAFDSRIFVYQIGPDVLRIRTHPGYEISVMINSEGADAFVAALDGSESVRMRLQGPRPDQRITVARNDDGSVDVLYQQRLPIDD